MAQNNITVTDKATKTATTVSGQEVSLAARSIVQVALPHDQVKSLARSGNDLVITTIDGQTIVVHGFFADGPGHSNLVLQDQDGLWAGDLSGFDSLPGDGSVDPSAGGLFSQIGSTDPLFTAATTSPAMDLAASSEGGAGWGIFGEIGDLAWLPVVVAAGGFATAAQSAGNALGTQFPVSPTATQNPNGTLSVSGKVNPGDTVTITYPDKTTSSGTADANGYYTVTSKNVQTSGQFSMVSTNASGVSSAPVTQGWNDHTKPQAPGVTAVTANADGTFTISGKAEPGSTVTVTFADKTTATAVADASGNYSVPNAAPKQSGAITVTATDAAGNVSPATTASLVTQTGAANDDGTMTVTGVAAPGSAITVTFTDGKTASGKADADGKYSVQSSDKESGSFTVQATSPLPSAPTVAAVTSNGDNTLTVTGTAAAGSTVIVTFADGSQATGTADATSGSYSVQSSMPQASGGALQVTATDAQGNTSAPSPALHVTQTSTVNTDGTLTVSGMATPGSTVTVTYADKTAATGTAGADGKYSIKSSGKESGPVTVTTTDLAPHPPTVDAVTTNWDGSVVVSGLAAPNSTVTVTFADNTTATGTANADGTFSVVSDTSNIVGGGPANGGPVSVTFSSSYPAFGVTLTSDPATITPVTGNVHLPNSDGTLTVSGTAAPNSAITITFPDGKTATGTADPKGSYSVTSNDPETDVASVKAVNPAPDTVITGIASLADGSVDVWGVTTPYSSVTVTFADGKTATGTADAKGKYDIQSSTAETGAIKVTATDARGQTGLATIATSPTDTATVNTDKTLTVTGTAVPHSQVIVFFNDGSNATCSVGVDGTYTVTSTSTGVTLNWVTMDMSSNPIGPLRAPSFNITSNPDNTLTIAGTTAAYSTVVVTFPDNTTASQTVDSSGKFSIKSLAAQTKSGDISVNVTDVIGTHSPPASGHWDGPPTQVTGTAISDVTENTDGSVVVTGTATAGGTVTVTFPDGSTASVKASATDGSFSANSGSAIQPGGMVQAKATDASGNASTVALHDYTPAPGLAVITKIGQDTVSGSYVTNAHALTFSGTLPQALATGQSLEISTDSGKTWKTVTPSGTTWSYTTPDNSLGEGNHTVAVRVADASHNTVSVSVQQVVVDTTAPTETLTIAAIQPDTGTSSTDFVTSNGSLKVNGTLSASLADGSQSGISAESVQVTLNGGQSWNKAAIDSGTGGAILWSFDNTAKTLPDGIYVVQAKVTDAAGNAGPLAVQQVEISANGTLNLSLQDVLSNATALTSAGSTQQKVMISNGGVVSTVHLTEGVGADATQWQKTGTSTVNNIIYDIYHNAQNTTTAADLLIQQGIVVS